MQPTISIVSDMVYGKAISASGAEQKLRLDWYHTQAPDLQPTFILLHGGDFRRGNKTALSGLCQALAAKGFTILSIDYRQGMPEGACGGNAYTLGQALYRPVQDVYRALSFAAAHASRLRIDTAKVFVGGAGAGAMAALGAAFYSQQDFNTLFPHLEQDLGPLQENGLERACGIKGVVNVGGGLLGAPVPARAALPVIGFYNQEDSLVPGFTGHYGRCANYPKVFGPQYLYRQLAAKRTATVLHEKGRNDTWKLDDAYIADNAACFVKAVLQGQRPVGVFANTITVCP